MYLYDFLLCPSACNITEYWGDGVGFPWSTGRALLLYCPRFQVSTSCDCTCDCTGKLYEGRNDINVSFRLVVYKPNFGSLVL